MGANSLPFSRQTLLSTTATAEEHASGRFHQPCRCHAPVSRRQCTANGHQRMWKRLSLTERSRPTVGEEASGMVLSL